MPNPGIRFATCVVWMLLAGALARALAQDSQIMFDAGCPAKTTRFEVSGVNEVFRICGANEVDPRIVPWSPWLPLAGRFVISALPSEVNPSASLRAVGGWAALAQRFLGNDGVLLDVSSKGISSGLWKESAIGQRTFGVITGMGTNLSTLSHILKVGGSVYIGPSVNAYAGRYYDGQPTAFEVFPANDGAICVPLRSWIDTNTDAAIEIIRSANSEVLTIQFPLSTGFSIPREAQEEVQPATLRIERCVRVKVTLWSRIKSGATRPLEVNKILNSNPPYMYQRVLEGDDRLNPGDTLFALVREYRKVPNHVLVPADVLEVFRQATAAFVERGASLNQLNAAGIRSGLSLAQAAVLLDDITSNRSVLEVVDNSAAWMVGEAKAWQPLDAMSVPLFSFYVVSVK
jgi:hypothetical protein